MEKSSPVPAEGMARPRAHLLWPLVLLGLVTWQGWMTWCLLGGWALLDERPVLSGLHPQHLYLGTLGAQSLLSTGRSCCYDDKFQAGYPKTPVFNGSRLAEVFLVLFGGGYQPVAYKVGLAIVCLLIPCLLILAARGVGFDWSTTTFATAAGLLVWWSPCSHEALKAGSSELLLGALAVLANVGMLMRFHQRPGLLSWLGLVFTASLGWFAQPMLFPIALPLFLMFYLHVGHQHGTMMWHLALLLGEVLSLALNATWLIDWVTYWWLRSPVFVGAGVLSHRTINTVWNAPLWGGDANRALALILLVSALVGLALAPRRQRTTARLLGTGTAGLFLLALLGISWEPLGNLGTSGLLAPALWFASLPAAFAWTRIFTLVQKLMGSGQRAALVLVVPSALLVLTFQQTFAPFAETLAGAPSLEYELGPDREALIDTINKYTDAQARILWEDTVPQPRSRPYWTPLLPLLTGRLFIGGLDPDGTIEHSTIGLADDVLGGMPIGQWSDQALEEYCKQYDIGWVVCFSPAAVKRFGDWSKAERIAAVTNDAPGYLFAIQRTPGFVLKGQAQLVHASHHHITLADVVPDDGVVVLSLHYQAGMRASPSRVRLEREPTALDPIGLLRLRVAGPVARLTLTWGER